MHLSDEFLSAYADGELPPSKAVAAAAHLRVCAGCTETVRLFAGLDERLSSTPALGCSAALSLVSAQLDGELDREETAIARLHLSSCADCRSAVLRWSVADQALAALPLSRPSARVDVAIAALGREPAGLRLPRVAWPVPAFAVALAVAVALVVNLSLVPAAVPGLELVAAEQSVLNSATGTLYVLHPENGTIAALDAQTLVSRGVISVGGRPTALALNPTTNTLVVLDATAKTVTEIDCTNNTVTSSTAVAVPGTPTSLQVDPSGKLVVTSIVAPASSIPAPAAAPAGVVSVFNGGTKKLETVRSVDVAAASVVWQPNGTHALLVSADSTTLVETATYQTIAKYGGGLAAVFSANGADFAILSSSTKDGAVVTRQSGSTVVGGTARAIAALPDGGFAVLSDANGRGHVVLIDASGVVTATLDVVAGGRDLTYDVQTRQLTVVGAGIVANVALPAPAPATSPAVTAVQPPATPTVTAPTVTAPTTDPAKPAVVAPVQPNAPVVEIVAPSQGSLVPSGAREVWPGTYLVQLAQRPRLAVSDEDRIWMLDSQNRLSALHPRSGELYNQLAQLPASAQITQMVVGPSDVFLSDPRAGLIYMFSIDTERLTSIAAPFLPIATDLVASPDGRLWIGTTGLGLLNLDPQTQKLVTTDGEPSVSAVGTDPLGRIWLGLGSRQVVGVYDPLTKTVTELNLPHDGSVSAIAIDGGGTVWVGTDTGQLFAIRNQQLQGAAALGRRIDDLVVDPRGRAWYVSRGDREVLYGLATGAGLTQHAARGASGPLFDRLGRAWLADGSSSGLFVTLAPGVQP